MCDDLVKRRTEIDFINGEIVEAGKKVSNNGGFRNKKFAAFYSNAFEYKTSGVN